MPVSTGIAPREAVLPPFNDFGSQISKTGTD